MIAARILTAYYFAHFLVVLPLLGLFEKPKPLPSSIAEAVLGGSAAAMPAGAARRRAQGLSAGLRGR